MALKNASQNARVTFVRTSAKVTWTTWCVGDKGQYVSGSRVFLNGNFGPPLFCE